MPTVIVSALSLLWILWFCFATVPVRIRSQSARVEAPSAQLQSSLDGRIVTLNLELGQSVAEGDILIELDAQLEWLRLEQAQARRDALEDRQNVSTQRLEDQQERLKAMEKEARANARAAEADYQKLREVSTAAKLHLEESRRLLNQGALSADVFREEETKARRAADDMEVGRRSADAMDAAAQAATHQLATDLETLRQEIRTLQGDFEAAESAVAEVEEQIERHRLRAPLDGVVTSLSELSLGQQIQSGETLATLAPTDRLRAVAYFDPHFAGRFLPDQPAFFRLDALPWLSHGTVPLQVRSVSADQSPEGLRLELAIGTTSLPLTHGMSGEVEVEVERSSPLSLLLETIGLGLTGKVP